MGVRGAILEVSDSLQKSWWHGIEVSGAQIEAKGILAVRRGKATVMVFPGIAHNGTPLLVIQYKEFVRKRPDAKHLADDIIEKLIASGAKRHKIQSA
jgi:hypothetical protein